MSKKGVALVRKMCYLVYVLKIIQSILNRYFRS